MNDGSCAQLATRHFLFKISGYHSEAMDNQGSDNQRATACTRYHF